MRRALWAGSLLLLLPGTARADQVDAIGPFVGMVLAPVAVLVVMGALLVAAGVRKKSRGAAVVVAGLGLLPVAGFGAMVVGDGGVVLLFLAAMVASLFAIPSRPPPFE